MPIITAHLLFAAGLGEATKGSMVDEKGSLNFIGRIRLRGRREADADAQRWQQRMQPILEQTLPFS
jgi:hypothetical protein